MVTPGALSQKLVFAAAILLMAIILAFDLLTDSSIRLHLLYIFPLAAVALHCEDGLDILASFFLALICELFTSLIEGTPIAALATDALVFFASSLLVVVLARAARAGLLPAGPKAGAGSRAATGNHAAAPAAKQQGQREGQPMPGPGPQSARNIGQPRQG